jgi:ABC-type transporter MlaC component
LHAGLLAAAAAGWPPERATIEHLVRNSFDLPWIARAVLGVRGGTATTAQQRRLTDALGRRMVREMMRRKPTSAADFQILGTRAIDRDDWLVTTRFAMPDGSAVTMLWRVRARPDGPRIVDGLRDGVSAVITMRQEIAEALRRQDLDDVIAEIERRAETAPQ